MQSQTARLADKVETPKVAPKAVPPPPPVAKVESKVAEKPEPKVRFPSLL